MVSFFFFANNALIDGCQSPGSFSMEAGHLKDQGRISGVGLSVPPQPLRKAEGLKVKLIGNGQ